MLHQTANTITRRTSLDSPLTRTKSQNGFLVVDPSLNGKAAKRENGSCNFESGKKVTTPSWVYLPLAAIAVITVATFPVPFNSHGNPKLKHVFFYGWLTALSTGLGVLPFACLSRIAKYWVGVSNAIAAGMMSAASYSLFVEGCTYDDPQDHSDYSATGRTVLGAILGLAFIVATKKFIDQYEDIKFGELGGTDARRALLFFFVMTLHSFSEGVGVGVSFGGVHGSELGVFISASLAVHNIPEGLAIAVVLLPRGASVLSAAVWAVCTSLPQPLMAVPAFLFVHKFIPILPVGLGFAAGAMTFVALFELMMEAINDTNVFTSCFVAIASAFIMMCVQNMIDLGSRS